MLWASPLAKAGNLGAFFHVPAPDAWPRMAADLACHSGRSSLDSWRGSGAVDLVAPEIWMRNLAAKVYQIAFCHKK
jgi:hypothetical protein